MSLTSAVNCSSKVVCKWRNRSPNVATSLSNSVLAKLSSSTLPDKSSVVCRSSQFASSKVAATSWAASVSLSLVVATVITALQIFSNSKILDSRSSRTASLVRRSASSCPIRTDLCVRSRSRRRIRSIWSVAVSIRVSFRWASCAAVPSPILGMTASDCCNSVRRSQALEALCSASLLARSAASSRDNRSPIFSACRTSWLESPMSTIRFRATCGSLLLLLGVASVGVLLTPSRLPCTSTRFSSATISPTTPLSESNGWSDTFIAAVTHGGRADASTIVARLLLSPLRPRLVVFTVMPRWSGRRAERGLFSGSDSDLSSFSSCVDCVP
eukprot:m.75337 g.75337  ORF g.75337 m.75337 type:complete len:328 (+) comp10405_c0_seq2:1028-2011(+)